jgi:hypothetical protein
MRTRSGSCPPGKWRVTPTTNIDTPMTEFNQTGTDLDKEGFNTRSNIFDDEEPKFYRQASSGPNTDFGHSAIEAIMDVLQPNHT